MSFGLKLLNIAFYLQALFFSALIVFVLSFYLILPIPFCTAKQNKSRIRNTIILYGYWLLKFGLFPYVKVVYKDFSTKKEMPCIFVCNHRSASDPYLMALLGVELVQIVKQWPFKIPFYGYFAKKGEYISVHDLTHKEFLNECARLLKQNVSIAAFPEGTRSGGSKMGPFTSSIFRVAYENKAPICPVCIVGNENIPNKNFLIRPGKIIVNKLEPILWNDYKGMSPFQLKNYVRKVIMNETAKMEGSAK
jgi:1-acyl-sn-glycerol-3-phosphate acyltransferase